MNASVETKIEYDVSGSGSLQKTDRIGRRGARHGVAEQTLEVGGRSGLVIVINQHKRRYPTSIPWGKRKQTLPDTQGIQLPGEKQILKTKPQQEGQQQSAKQERRKVHETPAENSADWLRHVSSTMDETHTFIIYIYL